MGDGGAIRAMLLLSRSLSNVSRECKDCGETTTGGKEFCFDHVLNMPYAKKLHDRLEKAEERARDKKLARVVGRAVKEKHEV